MKRKKKRKKERNNKQTEADAGSMVSAVMVPIWWTHIH